jgi:hypothetical protein
MNDELHSDHQYAELLEACLQAYSEGVPVSELVEPYPAWAYALRMDLITASWLSSQQTVVSPSNNYLTSARRDLLNQIKAEKRPAVSPRAAPSFGLADFFRWLAGNRLAFQLVSALLILVLLLGSFSGVAFASQAALPGENLYPVKTIVEDLRLFVLLDPIADAGLNLRYAGVRVTEMELLVAGNTLEYLDTPLNRYQRQVNAAMQDLAGVGAANTQRQIQHARQLVAALPAELTQHAQRFSNMASRVAGDRQVVFQTAQTFVTASLAQTNQLAAYLDGLTAVAGTLTPTATATGILDQLVRPGATATGFIAGPLATATRPVGGLLPSASPNPLAFGSLTPIAIPSGTSTYTALPTSTSALPAANPLPSNTPGAPSSSTPVPAANTPVSQPSSTPVPPPSSTPVPPPSNTPVPPPSSTPVPAPTNTLAPPPTNTPQPTNAVEPPPTATDEPEPTKKPSVTPQPTNTHRPTPLPTNPNRP